MTKDGGIPNLDSVTFTKSIISTPEPMSEPFFCPFLSPFCENDFEGPGSLY